MTRPDGGRRRYSRRALLAGGLTAGVTGLAGCTDGFGEGLGGTGTEAIFQRVSFDDPSELDGWPSRGYSPTNLGWKPNTTGPTGNVGVEWAFDTGTAQPMGSSPAVVDGTVYVGHADGGVYAVDAASGEEVWSATTGDPIRWSSPTVADGTVYIGSTDDHFYAFDAGSGDLLWRHETRSDVNSSPVVADGRVFFATDAGYVYGLDSLTGSVVWETPRPVGGRIQSGLAAADGTVYVTGGQVIAFDAASGAEQWRAGSGANQPPNGTPTVAGDLVLGEFGQYLGAVTTDGEELGGAYRYGVNGWGSPAVAGDTVYVATKGYSPDPTVHAVEIRASNVTMKATVAWQATTGRGIFSSPAVVDGTVYVASSAPSVAAFGAEDGAERWRLEVPVSDYSSPAVVDGRLYVGGIDGKLYALGEG
ncbi:PQQ-binding-like beta-propeller repeat protein [Haloglomus litoreum]|uniref:outer membrane protein assembly factor BamB family protein n=1 Tax=Haloglomus litoreum TaxID=3034026 RepID=UPI0023E81E98|nr:PQQ-binding-like beta-propeller repeat protein [Haloglomus sp. DT116]